MRIGKTFVIIIFAIAICGKSFAAFEDKLSSARETYLGGSYVCDINYYAAKNPAVCANSRCVTGSFNQTELFSMDELRSTESSVLMPLTKNQGIVINYNEFGGQLYSEKTIRACYGKKFGQSASIGAALKNNIIKIKNYGHASSFSGDFGGLIFLNDNITYGAVFRNIVAQDLGDSKEKPERSYRVGASLNAGWFSWYTDVEKNFCIKKHILHLGQETRFGRSFSLGLGWIQNPGRFSAGFNFRIKYFVFEYGVITHRYLGLEHHMGVSICASR